MKYVIALVAVVALRLLLYPLLKRLIMMLFVRQGVRGALEDAGRQAVAKQPDRITLVHRDLHSWKADPAVPKFADALFSRGFQEAGLFAARELPGVMVRFLVKSTDGVIAAICTHPRAGVWLDLMTYYQDGRSATYSTNKASGLDPRPGHPIMHAPGSGAVELYERCLRERPKGVFKPILPDDAPTMFERAYAEALAWRRQKGVSAAEVAQVAQRRAS